MSQSLMTTSVISTLLFIAILGIFTLQDQFQKKSVAPTSYKASSMKHVGDQYTHQTPFPYATYRNSNRNYADSETSEVSFGGLSKSECNVKFGQRRYLPMEQQKTPPVLYTFPGSGNTWCRLLIEYATGIYTGSIYNDRKLLSALPGEVLCSPRQSVIKAHPFTISAQALRTGTFTSGGHGEYKDKCKKEGIDQFHRAILLIRDPFDSIWSDYELKMSKSHVGGVIKQDFNQTYWEAVAILYAEQYENPDIEKHFAENDFLYIKYEALIDTNLRVDTLRNLTQFLNITEPDDAQLECAFALADNRNTHRVVDKSKTMTLYTLSRISNVGFIWSSR